MKKQWRKLSFFIRKFILLSNQSLLIKLCVLSSILVIFPVLSVGIISYKLSSDKLEEEFRESSQQIIEQVESHIEYYLQDFEIASLKIISSPHFANFLKLETKEHGNNQEFMEATRAILKEAEYSRADISNITVILDNDQVIDTLGLDNYYPVSKIKEEYWYSSVPRNGMIMLVSRTLKLKNNNEQPVISLARRLYNPKTLQPVGMLIIDINFRRIEEIANKVTLSKNGFFFILDSKGHYVYHSDYSKLGKKVEFDRLSNLKTEEDGSGILDNDCKDFFTYSFSRNIGWRFFTAVPYEDLMEGSIQIGKTISWIIIIALFFAYLIGFGFANSIIRPIRRLQHFMKEVEIGNLNGRVRVESTDEIGQLTMGFNNTVEKLSNLLEEIYISKLKETEMNLNQKEIELRMLQSQINPHFLYNSLETIRGMALEENREDIACMSSSLGKLLRYNLKNSSLTVSLKEEIKFCEMYLQIQKFRFEDRFEYMFDIPEWAMDLKVVKFSMQPLIENCFKHGFDQIKGKMKIILSVVRVSECSIVIRVLDTGVGIQEDILNEITKKIEQTTTANNGLNIGIINVHQRISYLFGSMYGITIQSTEGIGTAVDMHLPIRKAYDEEEEE